MEHASASGRWQYIDLICDSMPGYSDADTFAEMNKNMVEVFDFPEDGWTFQRDKANIGVGVTTWPFRF